MSIVVQKVLLTFLQIIWQNIIILKYLIVFFPAGGGGSWLYYIKKLGEIGEYHNSLPIINSIITNRMGLFKPNKFFSTLIFKNKFIIKILNFKDLKITLH